MMDFTQEQPENTNKMSLIEGIKNHKTLEILHSLIKAGADVNAKDNDGRTALVIVAQSKPLYNRWQRQLMRQRNLCIIHSLLEAGADVNAKDNSGHTALMYISRSNEPPDILRVLIKAGTDVDAKDDDGRTALIIAAQSAPLNRRQRQGNLKTIYSLIKAGADVNAKDNNGNTALTAATESNKSPKVLYILKKAEQRSAGKSNN